MLGYEIALEKKLIVEMERNVLCQQKERIFGHKIQNQLNKFHLKQILFLKKKNLILKTFRFVQ